jgi:hypothetical protein
MLAFRSPRVRDLGLAAAALALFASATSCGVSLLPQRSGASVRRPAASTRADLFMKSVEVRDGALGWRQLCPDLQSQIPESAVVSAARAQKAAEVGQVRSLRSELLGSRTLKSGEQLRLYLLTADLVGGTQVARLYVLHTQADGCVHAVQFQEVQ